MIIFVYFRLPLSQTEGGTFELCVKKYEYFRYRTIKSRWLSNPN